jgi:hypothetical protein
MKNNAKSKSSISRLVTAGIIIVSGFVFNKIIIPKLKERLLR